MVQQRRKYRQKREEIRLQLEQEKLAQRQQLAKDKLARQQRERQARAMADLANLEIPGELAFIYDKLDDWQPVHDGRNVITAVGEVQPMDMGYRLPVDINSHPFSKYTTVYFKDPQWGVMREPLLTPLTNVNGEHLSQHSLTLFKLILRYMCETNMSEKRGKVLADYIVQMGLRHEGLRDEILCQVANQTWQNQNVEQADKLWRVMAGCLSVFMPSSTLFKYLLKYVSDVAVNAYKWVCQHKVLQSANLRSQLSRIYPPCFLEWLCIQRKANMALEIKFPDDINKTGHVESWTSGELLGSYLLKQRGIQDNTQGWTLLLQDDVEFYELMGYDYVLDLLSEMEIAPGFPHSKAYFLVSLDRSQERGQHKRHVQEPHNAEHERVLQLVGQLPQMLKRSKPVVSGEEDVSRRPVAGPLHSTMKGMGDLGFSTTSILNQRPTDIVDVVLSDSPMNQRYNQRSAPNGHAPNGMDGVDPSTFEDDSADIDLSQTRMNDRYFPGSLLTAEAGDLSTTSRLNARYAKKMANGNDTMNSSVSTKNATGNNNVYNKKTTNSNIGARKSAVQDQIRKKQNSISVPADAVSVSSAHSDWSHWVEDVFHSALDEHDDGVSEGNPLHARIKGGGQGVPGVSGQQTTVPPSLNLGVGLTTPALSVAPPVMSPAFAFNTQPDALQQLVNQQALQQQAAQQVALQSLLLQNQQRQQQQALLQTLSQQQQQQQQQQQHPLAAQVAATQIALQQTELENKLLKQSIERENLKKQLLQLQQPSASPPASGSAGGSAASSAAQAGSLEASYSSAGLVPPPGVLRSPQEEQVPVIGTHGATAASSPGGPGVTPKRVTFLKSAFETQAEVERDHTAMTSNRAVAFSFPSPVQTDDVTAVSHPEFFPSTLAQGPPDSPPPPPPPPPPFPSEAMSLADQSSEDIYMDGFSVGPSLHTQPQVPYPPPPPPPPPFLTVAQSGLEIDKEKGTFTITDKHGVARTVRVGKVVWPPPMEEAQRKEVNVGKLEINENLAKGIEDRMGGKTKWQKPPSPETQDQPSAVPSKDNQDARPKQRAKLTENSEHSAAMLLLESKLGKPKTPTSESSPASRPLPPIPASESISVQTTDTLKRRQHAPDVQEEEEWDEVDAIYASTVIRDDPPAPSTQPPPPPPPPQRIQAKIIEESFESVVRPDLPPAREEFQPRVEPDVVPPVKSAPMIDYAAFERVVTELFPQNTKHFLMYNKVPWVLHLRKEVFWPSERVENLAARHLLYCQVVQDVHNNACVRLTKDQRVRMKSMLEGYGVNSGNYLTKELSAQVKKIIIDTAKEWPVYFCRLFPVASDGEYSQVRYLGVSHAGLRLVTRERSLVEDYLSVVEDVRFEDVVDVMLPNTTTVQLNLRTKSVLFQTPRAEQLKDMVDRFCQESEKGNKYVVAVKDYVTRESTLLSFKQGDVIKLVDPDITVQKDWLYGSLNGIVGLFPDQCVRPLALHEVDTSNIVPKLNLPPPTPQSLRRPIRTTGAVTEDRSDTTSQGTVVIDGQLSMMEFALVHFRQSQSKYEMLRTEDGSIRGTVKKMDTLKVQSMQTEANAKRRVDGGEWTRREQREMVQWTRSPIQASLLNLPTSEMNKMALECFVSIMQFMGDYPMANNQTDYDCVLTILKGCHKYSELRDEVYCQLCKQNTNNRSMKGKSKAKGWRLFALITAYCDCSELLRPCLFKFLETTATDVNRTYNYAAVQCLQNLRKTFKYGGRKNVPLKDEVQALADGRNCRRVPFYYSGSQEQGGLLQVKSCTVVQDCIVDACADLNISDPVEMEEYTFYVRAGDGTFSKLRREEYVLDMTAEFVRKKVPYDLVFQRTVWMYPQSHMDSDVYVDVMFHQCVFDYMDGLMIMWPDGQLTAETMEEIVLMAALLHKAGNFTGVPTLKQLDVMVPKTVRQDPTLRPQQWLNRVQEKQREVASHTALSAKALFLETLSRWPLFGSSFFVIKSIPNVTGECMLTVSKNGISFLHKDTHEFLVSHPFREILSTRRYNSDAGISFLDMKIGDLMVQKIVRIETDQGSEISNLISQYMQVINHQHRPSERL